MSAENIDLAAFKASSQRLSEGLDALSEQIVRAEGFFASVGVATEASVRLPSTEVGVDRELWIAKDGSEWKLQVRTYLSGHPSNKSPLLSASKAVRVEAVKHIPRLLEALRKTTDEQSEVVANQTAILSGFLDGVESKLRTP